VDVDAVEQRARNFRDVALDLRRRAVALARGIAEKSARVRVTSLRYPGRSTYSCSWDSLAEQSETQGRGQFRAYDPVKRTRLANLPENQSTSREDVRYSD
jgi:hypothetical protein